ncbi:restriction endonuclease, partial [Streptomyces sp. NPDC004980]
MANRRPPPRRRPAARRARRSAPPPRRSRRQQRRDTQLLLLGFGALAGITLVWAVISWLLVNWWALVVLGALAAVGGTVWAHRYRQQQAWDRVRQQALRYGLPELDALHHRDFEYAIRDLMLRDGCTDARQIGGAGDNGADVLATDPLGRTWVIQAKHRKDGDRGSAVGTPDLQRVNGTARQLYGADVVLVVTNGRFSTR